MTGAIEPTPTVLTGATGFVGRRLLKELVWTEAPVTVVLRNGSRDAETLRVEFPSVRIVEDPGSVLELTRALGDTSGAIVFHLATHFVAHHEAADVEQLARANVEFGMRIAETSVQTGASSFVYTASIWQRPGGEGSVPVSLYAATKQALEEMLRYYASVHGLPVRTVVLSDTYGPSDRRRKLLRLLLEHLRSGEPLRMSSGRQLIDLVHVDDVCSALIAASQVPSPLARWSATSGCPIRVSGLVDIIEEVIGTRPPVHLGALPDRPREMYEPWTGPQSVPNWEPKIPLERGVLEVWNDMNRTS